MRLPSLSLNQAERLASNVAVIVFGSNSSKVEGLEHDAAGTAPGDLGADVVGLGFVDGAEVLRQRCEVAL